ncbi:glycosyltransferase family 90 protein [Xylogone sp. PMI_703]|nr:glycosyltransferase family 90 protein [Xylogone sp. PMI_703]
MMLAATDFGSRRLFFLLCAVGALILLVNLSMLLGSDVTSKITHIPIPGIKDNGGQEPQTGLQAPPDTQIPKTPTQEENFVAHAGIDDKHPIAQYMKDADKVWSEYEESRSMTFRETVAKYRHKHGRHPPPGFRDWYKYARDKNVHNIDDFQQIYDDLRPFWAIEPSEIRALAAHMSADESAGISGLHIRNGRIWKTTFENWRMETFKKLVGQFVEHLPDMDVAMNRLDQPRLVVPWDDMQKLLAKEESERRLLPETLPEWTKDMKGFLTGEGNASMIDPQWFNAPGQQYMLLAGECCPPESHARDNASTTSSAESTYKDPSGGFITNFNRSSDLCTIGPEIQDLHGFLYASSTVVASKRLLPVFGECKVNVNNDILFPANMYYANDERYEYDSKFDYDWADKQDSMIWRGVTSGGTNTPETWERMHRQRLVLITNSTLLADKEVRIMRAKSNEPGSYENFEHYHPADFASKHTDIGFTEAFACFPNCDFMQNIFSWKPSISLPEQFKYKFVVDVDGHSFSGRWRAFLKSKSLGIKATIFREWHDSRIIPWRHFVPMDNRYDDIYSILTYFIGLGSPTEKSSETEPYVQRHEFEGQKLAQQGREWAEKVLRKEDLEIYTYLLLLEYGRIIDDNRDRIGYSGDGSELDKYDSSKELSPSNSGHA